MRIAKATASYEAWLGKRITLLPADLRRKHAAMAEGVFFFFRATFYRWMQLWPEVCAKECQAPRVLAVGDLHVENFGTWRDVEGRLVWGINDFDEVYELPYHRPGASGRQRAHRDSRGSAEDRCEGRLRCDCCRL